MYVFLLTAMISVARIVSVAPPPDMWVPVARDRSGGFTITGELSPPSMFSIRSSYRVKSHGCGDPDRPSRFSLALRGLTLRPSRVDSLTYIDVSDMVIENNQPPFFPPTLTAVCIGFNARISRTVPSLIYTKPRWGERLILSPSVPSVYAFDGMISYSAVHNRSVVFTRTAFGRMGNSSMGEGIPMTLNINDPLPSTVSENTFDEIVELIELYHGTVDIQGTNAVINAPNCYDTLTSTFPDLHYTISNDPQGPPVTDLVFAPADYIERTPNTDICTLMVSSAAPGGGPLRLTDHFVQKIGGIHFAYSESRIGFFDPSDSYI